MVEMVGGAFTVTTKLVDVDKLALSVTVSVMVVVPLCPVAGTTMTVRDAPEPPKTILDTGASVELLDAPVTDKDATGVTVSPTVKDSADVDAPMVSV